MPIVYHEKSKEFHLYNQKMEEYLDKYMPVK